MMPRKNPFIVVSEEKKFTQKVDPDQNFTITTIRFFPFQLEPKSYVHLEIARLRLNKTGEYYCKHTSTLEKINDYVRKEGHTIQPCPECKLDSKYFREEENKIQPSSEITSDLELLTKSLVKKTSSLHIEEEDGLVKIESKKRKRLDIPIFNPKWERNGKKFSTELIDVSTIPVKDLRRMIQFCAATSLSDLAFTKIQKLRTGGREMLIIKDVTEDLSEIVGFAIFIKEYEFVDSLRKDVIKFLKSSGYMPKTKDLTSIWISTIIDKIQEINKIYAEVDDIPQELLISTVVSLRNLLTAEEDNLYENVIFIAKWLYLYKVPKKEEIPDIAEINLDLICANHKFASFGILKGVLRWIQNEVLSFANNNDVPEAIITLTAVNTAKAAMYKAHGFRERKDPGKDEFSLITKNLLTNPLNVQESKKTKK